MFHIYFIVNNMSNKIYVGLSKNPTKRWKTHISYATGGKDNVDPSTISHLIKTLGLRK